MFNLNNNIIAAIGINVNNYLYKIQHKFKSKFLCKNGMLKQNFNSDTDKHHAARNFRLVAEEIAKTAAQNNAPEAQYEF